MENKTFVFVLILLLLTGFVASMDEPEVDLTSPTGEITSSSSSGEWDVSIDTDSSIMAYHHVEHRLMVSGSGTSVDTISESSSCYTADDNPPSSQSVSLSTSTYDPSDGDQLQTVTEVISVNAQDYGGCIDDRDADGAESDIDGDLVDVYEEDESEEDESEPEPEGLTVEDQTVSYSDEGEIVAWCDEGCPEEVEMDVCGSSETVSSESVEDNLEYSISDDVLVPEVFACGYGSNDLTVMGGDQTDSAELYVEEKGSMIREHAGLYLYVNMDYDEDQSIIYDFYLSNEEWPRTSNNPDTALMLKQVNSGGDDDLAIGVDAGDMISPLNDLTGFDEGEACDLESNICDVVNQRFTGDSNEVEISYKDSDMGNLLSQMSGNSFEPEELTPVHESDQYRPQGEIIVGEQPEFYNQHGSQHSFGSDEKFFVCREDAYINNGYGNQVPQVVQTEFNFYQCNTDSGEWNEIGQCQSGLDHDGEGVDHPDSWYHDEFSGDSSDPDCDTTSQTFESPEDACMPRVIENDQGEKVAEYGVEEGSFGDCFWPEDETEDEAQYSADDDPVVFSCHKETSENSDNEELTSDQRSYCNSLADSTFENFKPDGTAEEIPAVEYYIPASEIPTTEEDWSTAAEYVDNDEGFVNKDYQNLYEAMDDYHVNVWIDYIDEEPEHDELYQQCETGLDIGDSYLTTCLTNEYHPSSYQRIGFDNADGYLDIDHTEYIDSWNVENAAAQNENITSTGDHIGEDTVFPGGFYGDCAQAEDEDIRWFEQGNWLCTDYEGVPQDMDVVFYNIPAADETLENSYAGLTIEEEDIQDWELTYPDTPPRGNPEQNVEPLQATAQCWAGGLEERPDDNLDNVVNITSTAQEEEPMHLIGELPERTDVDELENPGDYSCIFGFEQQIESGITSNIQQVFRDGEPVEDSGETAYITEGNDQEGQLEISPVVRSPPTTNVDSWMEERAPENIGGENENSRVLEPEYIGENGLWPHHPTGQEEGLEEDVAVSNRNPLNEFINEYRDDEDDEDDEDGEDDEEFDREGGCLENQICVR